jgi:hypothetical protein
MSTRKELRDGRLRALAQKTDSPIELVAHLYDAELAHLEASSHVKRFIEIIAGRRVTQRLRQMNG